MLVGAEAAPADDRADADALDRADEDADDAGDVEDDADGGLTPEEQAARALQSTSAPATDRLRDDDDMGASLPIWPPR